VLRRSAAMAESEAEIVEKDLDKLSQEGEKRRALISLEQVKQPRGE
jgi:hypothetical protein